MLSLEPLFEDILLNVIFGGFLYGIMTVIALKGNASTGGVDFVALYISNKKGKSIWNYVFVFNAVLITIRKADVVIFIWYKSKDGDIIL